MKVLDDVEKFVEVEDGKDGFDARGGTNQDFRSGPRSSQAIHKTPAYQPYLSDLDARQYPDISKSSPEIGEQDHISQPPG